MFEWLRPACVCDHCVDFKSSSVERPEIPLMSTFSYELCCDILIYHGSFYVILPKIDPELWKNVFFEHQILPLDAIGILPHPLWISSDLQRSSQSGQGSPGKCPRSAARSSNCTADWGLWASKPGQTWLWQLWLRFFKTWQNRDSGFGHWKRLCLDMFSIV